MSRGSPRRRLWFTRALLTCEPLPFVLLLSSSWWTILAWLSHEGYGAAVAWTLLVPHHGPTFWLTLWTTLWVARLASVLLPWRWLRRQVNFFAIFCWSYAGYLLVESGVLTLASGMCVIMAITSLWTLVRERKGVYQKARRG